MAISFPTRVYTNTLIQVLDRYMLWNTKEYKEQYKGAMSLRSVNEKQVLHLLAKFLPKFLFSLLNPLSVDSKIHYD